MTQFPIFCASHRLLRLVASDAIMTSLIKMDSVWSEELEDKLVDLWQEHECLYKVTAGSYLLSI